MTEVSVENANLRLDKWLWYARFLKSRSLAAKLCTSGKIRVNSTPTKKPRQVVRVGDVLTFPLGNHIRVIEVVALGTRRGPAPEAQLLYTDLSPPQKAAKAEGAFEPDFAQREPGSGRPSKAERRALNRLLPEVDDV